MTKSELVYEFLGSQDLFTTPIDITGLQGNTYDYTLITTRESVTNNNAYIYFNNDTSSNYRRYRMRGLVSAASALTNDSDALSIWDSSITTKALQIFNITGSSGNERHVKSRSGSNSNQTFVHLYDGYWKDTLNEITSIQLRSLVADTSNCHIMLYRVPKAANQGNWEKVDELTWAAETAEKSFTGLDGNRDKKYRLIIESDPIVKWDMNYNGDTATNYKWQQLRNSSGTIAATNNAAGAFKTVEGNANFIINAKFGSKRLTTSDSTNTSGVQQESNAVWWNNTIDKVVSINIDPRTSTTGTATLYRMKGNGETDGSLPWELIEEVDVSGDFSAGHTFSNLTGNSEKLFRVEFVGVGDFTVNKTLRMQFNGNTGSIYTNQDLEAINSATRAAAATRAYIQLGNNSSGFGYGEMSIESIICPKIGSSRPILSHSVSEYSAGNVIQFNAGWFNESLTELTSIKIYAQNTSTVTGKLKLWRLK